MQLCLYLFRRSRQSALTYSGAYDKWLAFESHWATVMRLANETAAMVNDAANADDHDDDDEDIFCKVFPK